MATEVPMPKLGLTMEEAMIIEWLVADGEHVEADTPILLIETDKTETEVGAPGSGRLHRIGKPGDVYPCGAQIGLLLAEGRGSRPAAPQPRLRLPSPSLRVAEVVEAAEVVDVAEVAPTMADGRIIASPNARRVAAERGIALATVRGTGPGGRIVSEDVEAATVPAAAPAQPVVEPVVEVVVEPVVEVAPRARRSCRSLQPPRPSPATR